MGLVAETSGLTIGIDLGGSLSKTSWLRINREKNKPWLSIIDGKWRQRGETKPTTKAQLIEAFEVLDSRTQVSAAVCYALAR